MGWGDGRMEEEKERGRRESMRTGLHEVRLFESET